MNRTSVAYAFLAALCVLAALAVASVASAQDATPLSPAAPLPDGRYAVTEALARDYVVCAREADLLAEGLRAETARADSATAAYDARTAEAVHLRLALADGADALAMARARIRLAQADADAQRATARRLPPPRLYLGAGAQHVAEPWAGIPFLPTGPRVEPVVTLSATAELRVPLLGRFGLLGTAVAGPSAQSLTLSLGL